MTETTATAMPALPGDDDAFDPIEARLWQNIRETIEALFEEELEAAIGRCRHGRGGANIGCANMPLIASRRRKPGKS